MEQNYCESNRPLPSDQFRIPILVAFYTGCKILEANDSSRESTTISRKGARKTGCGPYSKAKIRGRSVYTLICMMIMIRMFFRDRLRHTFSFTSIA